MAMAAAITSIRSPKAPTMTPTIKLMWKLFAAESAELADGLKL